eukprot:518176_1
MSLFACTFLIGILVNGDVENSKPECDEIPEADLTEIDVLSFVEGSIHTKLAIAKRFDDAFHSLGAVRLINHGISYESIIEILNKTAEFFDESDDFKMKLVNTKNIMNLSDFYGFVPIGDETVGSYKTGQEMKADHVESFHIASNWANKLEMQKGNAFKPKVSALPSYLGDIMPTYWQKTRQLIYNIHWIASMALGFDVSDNIFEQNMSAHSLLDIRLSNYPALDMNNNKITKYRFNPHQDFTGFTNDNIAGLQVSVNDSDDNILWYNVPQKVGDIIVLGGEYIERWTNSYWISSLHAVKSLPQRRIAVIAFVSTDLDTIVDILPCKKCMQMERKFEPVLGYDHLTQRSGAIFHNNTQK